jgi:hypothetical protein
MSGTRTSDSTSTASGPLTVDQAADSIAAILAREDGEPEPRRKPEAPSEQPDEGEDQPDDAAEETPPEEEEDAGEPDPDPEDGAEAEDGTDEDEEQEPDDPAATAKAITVEIDGKNVTLTADEVQKGYLRTADYTRKTTALAEERKQLGAHAQAVLTERQQYAALLPALAQQLQATQQAEPNWEELASADPVEFNRLWAAKQLRDQKLQAIQSEQARLAAMQQEEAKQQDAQQAAAEKQRLVAANPRWKDPDVWTSDRKAVRDYLIGTYGYSADEVGNVRDHRAVVIAHKARLYDEMMAKATRPGATNRQPPRPVPQVAAKAPPPGAAPARRPVSELTRAKMSLAKTHSVADAARVIERLL